MQPPLQRMLSATGTIVEDGFWMDVIKTHCYVTFETAEQVQCWLLVAGLLWQRAREREWIACLAFRVPHCADT